MKSKCLALTLAMSMPPQNASRPKTMVVGLRALAVVMPLLEAGGACSARMRVRET